MSQALYQGYEAGLEPSVRLLGPHEHQIALVGEPPTAEQSLRAPSAKTIMSTSLSAPRASLRALDPVKSAEKLPSFSLRHVASFKAPGKTSRHSTSLPYTSIFFPPTTRPCLPSLRYRARSGSPRSRHPDIWDVVMISVTFFHASEC